MLNFCTRIVALNLDFEKVLSRFGLLKSLSFALMPLFPYITLSSKLFTYRVTSSNHFLFMNPTSPMSLQIIASRFFLSCPRIPLL